MCVEGGSGRHNNAGKEWGGGRRTRSPLLALHLPGSLSPES